MQFTIKSVAPENSRMSLRGYCTSCPKLACFGLYLKIINTLKNTYASYGKLFKELNNGNESLVGQAFYGSKQSKCCLDQ